MKIMVIFCIYSVKRLKEKRDDFEFLFKTLDSSVIFDLYFVNNAKDDEIKNLILDISNELKDVKIIQGSNKFAEFSAWVEGINYADQLGIQYDSYLLMNDTIYSHYPFYFDLLLRFLHHSSSLGNNSPTVVGTIVKFPPSQVLDTFYTSFICTAVFAFNRPSKPIFIDTCLTAFAAWDKTELNISSKELINFYFKGEQSKLIHEHLFEGGWYNSKPFDSFDPNLLRLKLTAIVCEHYFSARVSAEDGVILNVKESKIFHILKYIFQTFGFVFLVKTLMRFLSRKINT